MGFFDRIRSVLGGGAFGARVDFGGPLGLALGDAVVHYRERWRVEAIRVLDTGGEPLHHYCLCGPAGERAILVAAPGDDPVLSLQRDVDADIAPDAEVVEGVADEPFRAVARGRSRVHVQGAAPSGAAASVEWRAYADASGDRQILVEEYPGRREVRVGETVFAPELEFERGDIGTAPPRESADATSEDPLAAAPRNARGSPQAAARALLGAAADDEADDAADRAARAASPEEETPREEVEPGYEDERWADEQDVAEVIIAAADLEARPTPESEEAEWREAARFLREHGEAAWR